MKVRLVPQAADDATVRLTARVRFPETPLVRLAYPTRTGALLRIDGAIAGAFDNKHSAIDLRVEPGMRDLLLEVERRSLPTSGLPAGDGLRWRWLLRRAGEQPHAHLEFNPSNEPYGEVAGAVQDDVLLVGHAHLDVAWLWRYAEARRKALRTFATAIRQIDLDPSYRFAQSQPQLYAWIQASDPALFARVRERIDNGWDASVASMWVEPDLHAISGESILRQFALGVRWMEANLATSPTVAWLPDTFGFPATFPQLAAHAGMKAFATTKLQWNEQTRWPHPQFRWFGDDGSALASAVIDRYDGPVDEARRTIARERREPLICGFGDGGGGLEDETLAASGRVRNPWTTIERWFEEVETRALPEVRGELYLETHRGTYTTHRDVKSRNAALERALDEAEELVSWCIAIRVAPATVKPLADDLREARTVLARNQFHDVIAGTSIASVYEEVRVEHDRVERIAARVSDGARSILPRAQLSRREPLPCEPRREDGGYTFRNDYLSARVRDDGTIVELRGVDGPNLVAVANGLTAYVDKPKMWDAWNLDAGYERRPQKLKPAGAELDNGSLVVRLAGNDFAVAMRLVLDETEPFLRVEASVNWQAQHLILRAEHRLAIAAREVRFGQPHGSIVRSAYPETSEARARFEVPGQRWVHAVDGAHGLAILAPDTFGWSATGLSGGGLRIGASLLRAPVWPDPTADRGEHTIAYAFAPTSGARISALEAAFRDFVEIDRVRLFTCEDPGVLVVATKPADDGAGVIVRVRECDGWPHNVELRSGGRVRTVTPVDACERPIAGDAVFDGESVRFVLNPYALRSFRVTA
jgi:alpha-mannosidase